VGVLLHRLDRHGATLAVIAVEQPVVGARPDLLEFVRQVERILNTAVHAHTSKRIVDVRSVACQHDSAMPESFRYLLMHLIQRTVRNPVRFGPQHYAVQYSLQRLVAEQ
jgi:hypothetical protein